MKYINISANYVDGFADHYDVARAIEICEKDITEGQLIQPSAHNCYNIGYWILLCNTNEPLALVNLKTGEIADDRIKFAENDEERELAAEYAESLLVSVRRHCESDESVRRNSRSSRLKWSDHM